MTILSTLSGNISTLSKGRSIWLPLFESLLNSSSTKGSLVNSGSVEATGYSF
jgi:hypothetical protein